MFTSAPSSPLFSRASIKGLLTVPPFHWSLQGIPEFLPQAFICSISQIASLMGMVCARTTEKQSHHYGNKMEKSLTMSMIWGFHSVTFRLAPNKRSQSFQLGCQMSCVIPVDRSAFWGSSLVLIWFPHKCLELQTLVAVNAMKFSVRTYKRRWVFLSSLLRLTSSKVCVARIAPKKQRREAVWSLQSPGFSWW